MNLVNIKIGLETPEMAKKGADTNNEPGILGKRGHIITILNHLVK